MQVAALGAELRLTAQAAGPNASTGRKRSKAFIIDRDESVAGIGAQRNGRKSEGFVKRSGQVFQAMDGEIDSSVIKRLFNLLRKHTLRNRRSYLSESEMLHRVAAGADNFNGNFMAMCAKLICDVVGLPEGELRSARTDDEGISH